MMEKNFSEGTTHGDSKSTNSNVSKIRPLDLAKGQIPQLDQTIQKAETIKNKWEGKFHETNDNLKFNKRDKRVDIIYKFIDKLKILNSSLQKNDQSTIDSTYNELNQLAEESQSKRLRGLWETYNEGPAASSIRKKGWDTTLSSTLSSGNGLLFELTKTETANRLTCKEINEFYQEKLKTKLKNTVRKGLERLIKDGAAPLGLLEQAKNALDDLQTDNICHWEQLKPENLDCWYLQDFSTKKIYIGMKKRNNPYGINHDAIKNIKDHTGTGKGNYQRTYSEKLKTYLTLGIDEDKTIKDTNKIVISIDYYVPKVKGSPKIHVITTNESEIFVTDNPSGLSRDKYKDASYIRNKKKDKESGWTFNEIDPW